MAVDRLENSCSMNSSITPNYSMFVLGIGIMVELGTEIRYMIIGLFFWEIHIGKCLGLYLKL